MIALLWLLGCGGPQRCEVGGVGLQTTWEVVWRAPACDVRVNNALAETVEEIERELGLLSSESELHAIRDGVGRVFISEQTARLVDLALDVAAASEGRFDPTIEPLVRAWGLHDEPVEPGDLEVKAALASVGWQRIERGRDAGRPWIDGHGTSLDLSGLLEGHAADRLAETLIQRGLGDHLVTVGGERRAGGVGPQGPWRVGLDVEPDAPGADQIFAMAGGGLASAGSGHFSVGGVAYSKVLDPQTGRPTETDVLVAVVLAPTAVEADALATAWVSLGAERGLALIESRPWAQGIAYARSGERVESSGIDPFLISP